MQLLRTRFYTDKHYRLLGSVVLFIYMLPIILQGEGVTVRVHDYLDATPSTYEHMTESNFWYQFSNKRTSDLMLSGEVPRSGFFPAFTLITILHWAFEPFTVFVVLKLMMAATAFYACFWLMRRHFSAEIPAAYAFGLSVCYAVLPHYTPAVLTTSLLPLIVGIFIDLYNGIQRWWYWPTLLIVPFTMSFVFSGILLLPILGTVWLVGVLRTKKWRLYYMLGLVLLGVLWPLEQIQILYSMFNSDIVESSRIEYKSSLISPNYLSGLITAFLKAFAHPHVHAYNANFPIWILLNVIAFPIALKSMSKVTKRYFSLIVVYTGLFFIVSLFYWEPIVTIYQQIPLLGLINPHRLEWFYPLLTIITFGLALKVVIDKIQVLSEGYKRALSYFVAGCFVFQTGLSAHQNWIWKGAFLSFKGQKVVSWRAFFAEDLVKELKHEIQADPLTPNASSPRVLTLGFYPSILNMQGIKTTGGYLNNYPLKLKHRLLKGVGEELNDLCPNPEAFCYLRDFGGRFYFMPSEIDYHYEIGYPQVDSLRDLNFNFAYIRDSLNTDYVVSAYPIANDSAYSLSFIKQLQHPDSYWDIWLYRFTGSDSR